MFDQSDRLEAYLLLAGALSLIYLSIGSVIIPPASGYERSLYSAYGTIQYTIPAIIIFCSFSCAISINNGNSYWKISILLIFLSYLIFLFWPVFRGYALYGRGNSDILFHFGIVKSVLETGSLDDDIIRPVIYLISAFLRVFDIKYEVISAIISSVFTLLFILGLYSYTRLNMSSVGANKWGLIAALPFLFTSLQRTFHPAILSFMLVPLAASLYAKDSSNRTFVVVALLSTCIVLFHSVTAGLLIIHILAYESYRIIENYMENVRSVLENIDLMPLAGISILLITWYFLLTGRQSPIVISLSSLVSEGGVGSAEQVVRGTNNIPFERIITRAIEKYGIYFLYFTFAGITTVYMYLSNIELDEIQYGSYIHLIFGVVISAVFFFNDLVVSNLIRSMKYLIFGLTLVNSIHYQKVWSNGGKIARTFVIITVISAAIISTGAVYKPNQHLTYSEKYGTEWHLTHSVNENNTFSAFSSYKMSVFINGYRDWKTSDRIFQPNNPDLRIKNRITYHNNTPIADVYPSESYLITKTFDTEFYKWYPKYQWGYKKIYSESDVHQLHGKEGINKIYTGGNYTVWRIKY